MKDKCNINEIDEINKEIHFVFDPLRSILNKNFKGFENIQLLLEMKDELTITINEFINNCINNNEIKSTDKEIILILKSIIISQRKVLSQLIIPDDANIKIGKDSISPRKISSHIFPTERRNTAPDSNTPKYDLGNFENDDALYDSVKDKLYGYIALYEQEMSDRMMNDLHDKDNEIQMLEMELDASKSNDSYDKVRGEFSQIIEELESQIKQLKKKIMN